MESHHVLTFPPTRAAYQRAADDLRRALDDSPIRDRLRYNVELVFEEIATNIIRHSRASEESEIVASIELGDNVCIVTFEDGGMPFDPSRRPDPDAPSSIDGAEVGGLGLVLVRRACTRVDYERTAQERNRLRLTMLQY